MAIAITIAQVESGAQLQLMNIDQAIIVGVQITVVSIGIGIEAVRDAIVVRILGDGIAQAGVKEVQPGGPISTRL